MRIQRPLYFAIAIAVGTQISLAQSQPIPPKLVPRSGTASSAVYVPPPAWKSVEIGNFYFRRKDYRGALSRYLEATHTDPDYAPAYLGLGKAYEKTSEKRKALAAYKKYLDELPSAKQAEEDKVAHRAIQRLEREIRGHPRRSSAGGRAAPQGF